MNENIAGMPKRCKLQFHLKRINRLINSRMNANFLFFVVVFLLLALSFHLHLHYDAAIVELVVSALFPTCVHCTQPPQTIRKCVSLLLCAHFGKHQSQHLRTSFFLRVFASLLFQKKKKKKMIFHFMFVPLPFTIHDKAFM